MILGCLDEVEVIPGDEEIKGRKSKRSGERQVVCKEVTSLRVMQMAASTYEICNTICGI